MAAAFPYVMMGLSGISQAAQLRSQGEYEASQLDRNASIGDVQARDAIER